jgi:hypothetical protein
MKKGFLVHEEMHCTENPICIFPEKELRGLSPNSYIQVSVSDLYIPPGSVHIFGGSKIYWKYINLS